MKVSITKHNYTCQMEN